MSKEIREQVLDDECWAEFKAELDAEAKLNFGSRDGDPFRSSEVWDLTVLRSQGVQVQPV